MRAVRFVIRGALGCIGVLALYCAAAALFGLLPANRNWRMPAHGVTIWLTTNGVHSDLLLPLENGQINWAELFPPSRTRQKNLDAQQTMVSIGWGDRDFFLHVPTWAQLEPGIALRALLGLDGALLHVTYLAPPLHDPDALALTVSPEAYARLIAQIRASLKVGPDGKPVFVAEGYERNDVFYEATGHYSLFVTCNEWVRNALAHAGVRVPLWAPFDRPLFWQLRHVARPAGEIIVPHSP